MSYEVREMVRTGAALLDEKEPGWRDRISPAELDLSDCDQCVLGQVFGRFGKGVRALDVFNAGPVGFDVFARYKLDEHSSAYINTGIAYDELTEAWVGYLKGHWE